MRKQTLSTAGNISCFQTAVVPISPTGYRKKVEYDFNHNDPKDQYAKLYSDTVVDTINSLNLPRYGLGNYLDKKTTLKPTKEETVIQDNLSHAGRRLMGFCRTNLFKRLESSGYSFLVSLSRHILRNYIYVYALENNLLLPIGAQEANMLDEFLDDVDFDNAGTNEGTMKILLDEEGYYAQAKKIYTLYETNYHNRFDWIRSGFFENTLKNILINDSKEILKILKIGKDWNPADDRRLNALYDLCANKYPKGKLLIFTQFSDTAYYLHDELKKRNVHQIECVTGDSEDPTTFAYRFSPVSNNKKEIANARDEIRVLITTDVLSEGQNLQDGHIIVNYDLPWAIIRLIQRAGRVDRIGQKSDKILCYSFLPEDGIEKIIKLRGRLGKRIKENAEVVGSDEVFFDGDPVRIHDFYNEKQGILDEEDDTEVDLASYAYQIWKNATDADPTLKKTIPDLPHVIYATKSLKHEDEKIDDGVVVYTRTADDNDVLIWVDRKGEIITQSQLVILRAAECNPDTTPLFKLDNHHKLVEKGIEHIIQVESTIGGQLGKKSSARYRTYMRLNRHYEEYKGTLFVNDAMKRAIDDIYKFPLKEFARETLNRQLKAGISDEDLANLVVSLRDEDKLCNTKEEEKTYKEPQIICSLGLIKKQP
ncbi:MAG: SWF/SNF helicase family protein [Candidatus Kuenenia sp.]|uniref:C-terminal helicase domain-containing protein n=1 Tax=Candidatus Kuenenia sp. TaxID=2499824 RepID=UPI0022CA1625|nr:C-terminal helicase domain-containing protein [Candidatus Kuenenia sp.]MCZ7623400.1 SWF/SNF helicase family protein [Candidatus Kuenenia sp.]